MQKFLAADRVLDPHVRDGHGVRAASEDATFEAKHDQSGRTALLENVWQSESKGWSRPARTTLVPRRHQVKQ